MKKFVFVCFVLSCLLAPMLHATETHCHEHNNGYLALDLEEDIQNHADKAAAPHCSVCHMSVSVPQVSGVVVPIIYPDNNLFVLMDTRTSLDVIESLYRPPII